MQIYLKSYFHLTNTNIIADPPEALVRVRINSSREHLTDFNVASICLDAIVPFYKLVRYIKFNINTENIVRVIQYPGKEILAGTCLCSFINKIN